MKVSVISPTYKRGWSLPYMLDSLRNQTRKPDEIIIVLKRSEDESENIINKYNDLPIRTLIQKEGGVPQAYDLGIKNAQGDLLLFIDDDAIAEPLWIEKYITFF
ncbi:MAG: glycosyltransferase family 2 protein [Nitrososphaeria archaeon]